MFNPLVSKMPKLLVGGPGLTVTLAPIVAMVGVAVGRTVSVSPVADGGVKASPGVAVGAASFSVLVAMFRGSAAWIWAAGLALSTALGNGLDLLPDYVVTDFIHEPGTNYYANLVDLMHPVSVALVGYAVASSRTSEKLLHKLGGRARTLVHTVSWVTSAALLWSVSHHEHYLGTIQGYLLASARKPGQRPS